MRAISLSLVTLLLCACGSDGSAPSSASATSGTLPAPAGDAASPATSPSTAADAGQTDLDAATPSRCQASAAEVTCTSQSVSLLAQGLPRDVFWQVPLGVAPAKGWPTVLFFQGSFTPASGAFAAKKDDAFGLFNLTRTVKELLDHGYAVVAPNAAVAGRTAWLTNVPPWSDLWSGSSDDAFMLAIFDALAKGQLGALDPARLHAMGISSGGFMTSRMAVSYAGRFRSLAVHSAGYATCGTTCTMPASLPSDHPPTFFLHGAADTIAQPSIMAMYRDQLAAEGHEVKTLLDPSAGHEWLVASPVPLRQWFDAHP